MTTAITPNAGNHENLSGLQSGWCGKEIEVWSPFEQKAFVLSASEVRVVQYSPSSHSSLLSRPH